MQPVLTCTTGRVHLDVLPTGHTEFTTCGAHDVIAITSLQMNDLCTKEIDHNLLSHCMSHVSLSGERGDSSIKFLIGHQLVIIGPLTWPPSAMR